MVRARLPAPPLPLLSLLARSIDRKWWTFRRATGGGTDANGKTLKPTLFEFGLGTACGPKAVSLADARHLAEDIRRAIKAGLSPEQIRQTLKLTGGKMATSGQRTFKDVAEDYIGRHEKNLEVTRPPAPVDADIGDLRLSRDRP